MLCQGDTSEGTEVRYILRLHKGEAFGPCYCEPFGCERDLPAPPAPTAYHPVTLAVFLAAVDGPR